MPLPDFNINGVLPPFLGDSPAGPFSEMSPYRASAVEVVQMLSFSEGRKSILRGWLLHRKMLRAIGFESGFQWLDGSFVEKDKEPGDIDVMTFLRRPPHAQELSALEVFWEANLPVLDIAQVKRDFSVHFFPMDLDGDGEVLVDLVRYHLSLFSHRRDDLVWKGMIQVPVDSADDDEVALKLLGLDPSVSGAPTGVGP